MNKDILQFVQNIREINFAPEYSKVYYVMYDFAL